MSAAVWINQRVVPVSQATVSVFNRGFMSGFGVFETLKVTDGNPFAVRRHIDRLLRSAQIVGFELPERAVVVHGIEELLAANPECVNGPSRLRITATPSAQSALPDSPETTTVVMTVETQPPHPPELKVVTAPWPHNERGPLVGAKTTSYADNLAILRWARSRNADEALLANTGGLLCEATTANVLYCLDGKTLATPSLASGCLGGVTRELLVQWGLVVEADVEMADLASASEILIASSTRDLIPVVNFDGRSLPAPGPRGSEAMAEFSRRAGLDIDP